MSDDLNGKKEDIIAEAVLNDMIRRAVSADVSPRIPSEDTILAHFLGTASPEQEAEFQAALDASSEFRAEMVAMARDLANSLEPNGLIRTAGKALVSSPKSVRQVFGQIWSQLSTPSFVRYASLAGGAALVAIVSLSLFRSQTSDNLTFPPDTVSAPPAEPFGQKAPVASPPVTNTPTGQPPVLTQQPKRSLSLVEKDIERGLVSSLTLRGAAPAEDSIFPSAREAALACFRANVTLDDNYELETYTKRDEQLTISDIEELHDDLALWKLELTTRNLYYVTDFQFLNEVDLDSASGRPFVAVITVNQGKGFKGILYRIRH